ncbi:MAG: hypothetical protein M1829_002036 [Trizodia sp. TS-e1964]|nr:MAG: hypothetical protein M1829_002036 [Trizodia sp. TS-e1964]
MAALSAAGITTVRPASFKRLRSNSSKANHDTNDASSPNTDPTYNMWERLGRRVSNWMGKDELGGDVTRSEAGAAPDEERKIGLARRFSRKVVPGLPRPGTFRRQQSELRERLVPHQPERRAFSVGRSRREGPRHASTSRPPKHHIPSLSAPDVLTLDDLSPYAAMPSTREEEQALAAAAAACDTPDELMSLHLHPTAQEQPPPSPLDVYSDASLEDRGDDKLLDLEMEERWILNLSMHFRDRSDREKFFVTFAETPNKWRRVTVSCDYRDAPPDSLENDLRNLNFQRDKSERIYESIRESLADIQFYDTVTNLKLQTTDGRLHVHVTEDVHEVIPYPSTSAIGHLDCPRYPESSLEFDSHLSGFVYKVRAGGQTFIKKEIPGPDTVEEFLYEINALNCLRDSKSVIHFGGVIVDDKEQLVKGLLISFAEQGALVDIIYDKKGHLPWKRRERWAKQIVQGLSEIHEGGFVQGDFTLSNIVVDDKDDAKIIDINRRGCPVGWEPPEVSALIGSGQRITMYIGVKSDLFQLGMVLWALAEEQDEPENQQRPLTLPESTPDIPSYFRQVVQICLDDRPQNRRSARDLLQLFPEINDAESRPVDTEPLNAEHRDGSLNAANKRYIDPLQTVTREDIDKWSGTSSGKRPEIPLTHGTHTYLNATTSSGVLFDHDSDSYPPPSGLEAMEVPLPSSNSGSHEDDSSLGDAHIVSVSPSDDRRWEEIECDGIQYLLHRDSLDLELKEPLGGVGPGGTTRLPAVCAAATPIGKMTGDLAGVGSHTTLEDCSPRGP